MREVTLELIQNQKKKSQEYLFELQKFLDVVDNIQDVDFKNRIIFQMLKVDEALTRVLEESVEAELYM